MYYVINKHDLVRFKEPQVVTFAANTYHYPLLQMFKLKLKTKEEYRWNCHTSDNYFEIQSAFQGIHFELTAPPGTELKFHNVENPVAAECYFRNPELAIAEYLGLDLTNKKQKKLATDLGKSIGRVSVDLTKLAPWALEIIPDPKSKAQQKSGGGAIFGKPAAYSTMELGKVYVANITLDRWGREGSSIYWLKDEKTGSAAVHAGLATGTCLTVVECEKMTLDERIPEFFYKKIRLLAVKGGAQPMICTGTIPGNSDALVKELIEVPEEPVGRD
jgi:hypothetical protein